MNQCDGCLARMPIKGGIHYYKGKAHMACTAKKYGCKPARKAVKESIGSPEIGEFIATLLPGCD